MEEERCRSGPRRTRPIDPKRGRRGRDPAPSEDPAGPELQAPRRSGATRPEFHTGRKSHGATRREAAEPAAHRRARVSRLLPRAPVKRRRTRAATDRPNAPDRPRSIRTAVADSSRACHTRSARAAAAALTGVSVETERACPARGAIRCRQRHARSGRSIAPRHFESRPANRVSIEVPGETERPGAHGSRGRCGELRESTKGASHPVFGAAKCGIGSGQLVEE